MKISSWSADRCYRSSIAAIVVLLAVGCQETTRPPADEPIQLPLTNQIVFQSTRLDSLRDIWVMSADGNDLRRLSDTTTRDGCPALSPDGYWIAFHQLSRTLAKTETYPSLQDSLVLMRADGSNRIALAQLERYAFHGTFCPQWSADAERILTVSATEDRGVRSNQNYRSRVLDRAGTVLATYNFEDNWGVTLRAISLSPDGTRILASVSQNSTAGPPIDFRVYSLRIDGTDPQLNGEGADGVWSPAGNAIAWNCFGICISTPAGANVRTMYSETTAGLPFANSIGFSPDGAHIAFGCGLSGSTRRSLCIGDVATLSVEEIPVAGAVGRVTWMADNSTVVFECRIAGKDICVAKRGSDTFSNLTSDPADDLEPSAR